MQCRGRSRNLKEGRSSGIFFQKKGGGGGGPTTYSVQFVLKMDKNF